MMPRDLERILTYDLVPLKRRLPEQRKVHNTSAHQGHGIAINSADPLFSTICTSIYQRVMLRSLHYMVSILVVNNPLRRWCGILGRCYLVCLVCLKSLVQILRSVTLTIHKLENGVLREVLVTFRKVRKARIKLKGFRRVILRDFHNISAVDLPLVKSIEGLSVIDLQCFHCILTQQLIDLWWQIDGSIIPFEGLLGS